MSLSRLAPTDLDAALPSLAETLHACVHAGASVGFVLPFNLADSAAFWSDRVFPGVRTGQTALFVARSGESVIGTVQLVLAGIPNQMHRADVAKMLVHPDHRRHGIARTLMETLLDHARDLGRTLLVLDTRSGDPAERLYRQLGFQVAGSIPDFCRNPFENRLEPTTYLFKALPPRA